MGAMKELFTEKQEEFFILKFTKDGCPADKAKEESWESMVENLFDGNEDAAFAEFYLWLTPEG